ncbi:hypothetical protein [Thomasclavelia spiroformis]|jgi:hypothetical protein|uniref:hypothetical protein n=1 Tax=Thomasclavelia spiroformis TaxID=29348 RepID=UPI000B3934AF|nr:hypothetical protein [Thomasclavelia spiroformis]OUQ00788.1 hypothetical protein B5E98_09015 [Thomasclavelia spiroformis]
MKMINYSSYITTLKEASKDTSSFEGTGKVSYMTDSIDEVVNFDLFQEDYFKSNFSKSKKTDSIDVLCMLDCNWCLIEFKNGAINASELRNKIGNSVSIITFKDNIQPKSFKENSIFILVYNKAAIFKNEESYQHQNEDKYLKPKELLESKSFDLIQKNISQNAKQPIVKFGLKTFEGVFFTKVMTMDKDVFNSYILDKEIILPND